MDKEQKRIQRREQKRRYRQKYPEKVKEKRIRYLDKKIRKRLEQEPEYLDKLKGKLLMQFDRLTRLMFKDKLPRICQECKAEEDLHIHHIRYVYPINPKDLMVLCRRCHILEHQREPPLKREGTALCPVELQK